MCNKFIGFGSCSKSYLYILFAIILKGLDDNFFSFTSVSPEMKTGIFTFTPVLANHIIIQNFYKYVSFIIGGLIFGFILKKNLKTKKKKSTDDNSIILNMPTLLYNNNKNPYKTPFLEICFISFIYALHNELLDILYLFNIINLYFWTIQIIFIFFFMNKIFIIKFYNFQKCSLYFMIVVVSILLIISSFLPVSIIDTSNDGKEKESAYDIIKLLTGSYLYDICLVIIINFLSGVMSYARVKVKVFVDYKYVSPYQIIVFIGIFGIFLTIIELIITSSFKCHNDIKHFCMAESSGSHNKYIDNIKIYFSSLKELTDDWKFYVEIIIIQPIFLIINFFELVCEFLVIIRLNPIFVLIQNNFNYAINNVLFLIFNNNQNFEEYLTLTQFYISESAEIIAIICYMIYLQIIELRFCGLDKYLKKNLILISKTESSENDDYLDEIDKDGDVKSDISSQSNQSVY